MFRLRFASLNMTKTIRRIPNSEVKIQSLGLLTENTEKQHTNTTHLSGINYFLSLFFVIHYKTLCMCSHAQALLLKAIIIKEEERVCMRLVIKIAAGGITS